MEDSNQTPAEPDAEFATRVFKYLEEDLSGDDLALLNRELKESRDKQQFFVRCCRIATLLGREATLRRDLGAAALGPSASADFGSGGVPENSESSMEDAMIIPAIAEEDWSVQGDEPLELPDTTISTEQGKPAARFAFRRWKWVAAAAVIVLTLTAAILYSLVDRRPLLVTAVAGAVDESNQPIIPQTILQQHAWLHLKSGTIELKFSSGATAVLVGPARLQVIDGKSVDLEDGAIYAHVPVEARGFKVLSPGMSVVDLGTNFGVRVLPDNRVSEMQVYEGSVEAALLDVTGKQTSQPTRVLAGHGVNSQNAAETAASAKPTEITFEPTRFVRDIQAARSPVKVFGTGVGLPGGSNDPHWQSILVPQNNNWRIRPAVVVSGPFDDCVGNSADSQWISIKPLKKDMVRVGEYTFRTTVDLTGFDPATVEVHAAGAADDYIADVLVNGVSTGASTPHAKKLESILAMHELKFSPQWKAGANTVDLVIENLPNKPGAMDEWSGMSFQFQWSMTATPIIRR